MVGAASNSCTTMGFTSFEMKAFPQRVVTTAYLVVPLGFEHTSDVFVLELAVADVQRFSVAWALSQECV